MQEDYNNLILESMEWINKKIEEFNKTVFSKLENIESFLLKFNVNYLKIEKSQKQKTKKELKILFFNIKSYKYPENYVPLIEKTITDLEFEWNRLEKAEILYEKALKNEFKRKNNLDSIYSKFEKKVR